MSFTRFFICFNENWIFGTDFLKST